MGGDAIQREIEVRELRKIIGGGAKNNRAARGRTHLDLGVGIKSGERHDPPSGVKVLRFKLGLGDQIGRGAHPLDGLESVSGARELHGLEPRQRVEQRHLISDTGKHDAIPRNEESLRLAVGQLGHDPSHGHALGDADLERRGENFRQHRRLNLAVREETLTQFIEIETNQRSIPRQG